MAKKKGLAPAPDFITKLSQFEELTVVGSAIEIPGAAGGLRDAMKIEPQEFHHGERVFVVMECIVGKVRFEPADKDEPDGDQLRVHTFRAGAATIIDADVVSQAIDDQKEKLELARERAKGVMRFDYDAQSELEREQAERVELWLRTLKRAQLRELCDAHGVAYTDKSTAPQLIGLLADKAPEIEERMGSLKPSLESVPDVEDEDLDLPVDEGPPVGDDDWEMAHGEEPPVGDPEE